MAADPLQLERDEVRFERLYREHAADVYRYALAIMRNPSDAEDVVQATFLNAWRAFSAGEEPRTPLNWLITIAHNVCRLRFRTNSRRPKEVEFEPALAEAPVDDGPTAGDVLDALAELPLNQRAALVMRELEGRSYGEIATVLGISRSAVETLIFRARRSLRVRRDAIRTLTLLPLPQSLTTFLRAPGTAEAGATAILGSGFAAKAVALVAAGVVATGVARDTVRAEATPNPRVARPAQVETVAPWAATSLALLLGGQAAPARSAPATARSVPPAVGPRQVPPGGGGRLAAIDEPEGAPGAAPGAPGVPTPSQPEQRAQPVGPEPGGKAPPRNATPTLPTVPGGLPSPPPVPGLLPTLPEPPILPQLPPLPPPSLPPVSTPELPVPEVPIPDLPKLPEVPAVPLPPPPPVDLPDRPDLPDLPKLP